MILKDILEEEGYEVLQANDGVTGLNLVLETKPALIIVDWRMPVMDGIAVIRSLRGAAGFETIPIILLTVDPAEERRDEARKSGVNEVLTKPIDGDELLARVRALVDA